jgi:Trypsin-like peptidase domain
VTSIKLTCKKDDQEFTVRGTGFLVDYRDPRLGKGAWSYLVTNRHVAFCWDESSGLPMRVKSVSIRLSRKEPNGRAYTRELFLSRHGNVRWFLPEDDSVDLAVIPLTPDETKFDFRTIPADACETLRASDPVAALDGETVFFAGFFQQFRRTKRIQPILQQGRIVGMTPNGEFPLVGMPMKLYLTDIQVFGGNSGSPAFTNETGYHDGNFRGQDKYRLVGIVNGFISLDEHFSLKLATTVQGTAAENSRVATMVPVDELSALLHGRKLQAFRDAQINSQRH